MELSFTLQDNINESTSFNSYSIIHKLKNPNIRSRLSQEDITAQCRNWMADRKRIFDSFNSNLNNFFDRNESFHLLIPATTRVTFTNPLKDSIINTFANCIDISGHFSKNPNVSFGTPPYSEKDPAQLEEFIQVSHRFNQSLEIKKVLVADDVYSSGKTMDVYESVIKKVFPEVVLIGATLIRTR